MRLIHSTQKLLKELAVITADPGVAQINPEGLGNWYANLLRFDRRKCVLLTNERTLYTFLIPGVLKKDLLKIENLFRSHLAFNLQYEGFGAGVIEQVLAEYKEIGFARTNSKSVLGSMNDLKVGYEAEVYIAGGIEYFNVLAVNQKINETPLKAIKYNYPIEELKRVVAF